MEISLTPLGNEFPQVIAVDEGLDRLVRLDLRSGSCVWMQALAGKSRSLQLIDGGRRVLAVSEQGWLEFDVATGRVQADLRPFVGGVISVQRLARGETFCAGLDLLGSKGLCFARLSAKGRVEQSVRFEGDYVRRTLLTPQDTLLFTCDTRVYEGTWDGRILREFGVPGFRHAWKALRLGDDRTLISAGYGAFAVEFDASGQVTRRWECREEHAFVRPFFFGDMQPLDDGGLLVCNWLGHGHDLGDSGCSLLRFDADSQLLGAWKDGRCTSSLQTFVCLP